MRRWATVGLCLAALAATSGCRSEPRPKPNLIVISIDTLRANHTSPYGYPEATSPNLAELGRDGVVFENAFVQSPWTIPSHGSMLTGRYPCVHHATETSRVADDVPLLAERLAAAGYRTGGFVDTVNLGMQTGMDRGFEVFDYDQVEDISDFRVMEFLEESKSDGRPFFLFLHTFGVHGPFKNGRDLVRGLLGFKFPVRVPDGDILFLRRLHLHDYLRLERYQTVAEVTRDYDAGIRRTDGQLAVLIARLKAIGLYDDTVIVVTSDHGEKLFDRKLMIGHGLFMNDEELHVPLIIKPARKRPAARRIEQVVESVDIVPTSLALLGFQVPAGLDGQNLEPLVVRGDATGLDDFATGESSILDFTPYLRTARWKYIAPTPPAIAFQQLHLHLRPDPGISIMSRVRVDEQLYDLEADPGETANVSKVRPDVTAGMRERLASIRSTCRDRSAVETVPEAIDDDHRARLKALGYIH